jgi:hypothetical protein
VERLALAGWAVITYWVQSRPSVLRTARSCVAFRRSWMVSSLASGSGITVLEHPADAARHPSMRVTTSHAKNR